jgi:hypothetical protein
MYLTLRIKNDTTRTLEVTAVDIGGAHWEGYEIKKGAALGEKRSITGVAGIEGSGWQGAITIRSYLESHNFTLKFAVPADSSRSPDIEPPPSIPGVNVSVRTEFKEQQWVLYWDFT